jgi:hypothetical protein
MSPGCLAGGGTRGVVGKVERPQLLGRHKTPEAKREFPDGGSARRLLKKEESMFFSEEKNQKTFTFGALNGFAVIADLTDLQQHQK